MKTKHSNRKLSCGLDWLKKQWGIVFSSAPKKSKESLNFEKWQWIIADWDPNLRPNSSCC